MNVRFFAGTKTEYLDLAKHNPTALYFCKDTSELFWGNKLISDGMRVVQKDIDLPAIAKAADGVIYYVVETRNGYVASPNRTEWLQVIYAPNENESINPDDYYTKAEVDAAFAKIEFPDTSKFITSIPDEYITETDLELRGYATKVFVLEKILETTQQGHHCDHGGSTSVDLSNYATKDDIKDFITEVPAEYITEDELTEAIAGIEVPAIPEIDLTGLATEEFVLAEIAKAELNDKDVDLSAYYTKTEVDALIPEVPTKVSELENDAGYLTEHQDLSDYALKADIEELASIEYVDNAIAAIPETDLSNYYNKSETEILVNEAVNCINIPDTSSFITMEDVETKGYLTEHQDLSAYAKRDELPSLAGYATETFVLNKIAEAELGDKDVDLSGYVTKDEIKDFATTSDIAEAIAAIEIPSIEGLASKSYVDEAVAGITVPEVDLSEYAKLSDIPSHENLASIEYVNNKIAEISDSGVNLDGYATEDFVASEIAKITIPDVTDFATKEELVGAIAAIEHPMPDLSDCVKKDEIAEYITEEELDAKGYLTEHQDISNLATKAEIPDVSNFITEIPDEYITEEELHAKGYLTEHQDLGDYAKKSELFNKDYNELVNTPEIPSITGLATESYVDEKFGSVPETYLTDYATEEFVIGEISKLDIPEVNLAGYATEEFVVQEISKINVPEVDHFATKTELADAIDAIEHPAVDLTGYATEELVAEVSATKANVVPFTTPKLVNNAIGGFVIGEDISGLTIAELFAKLLELSDGPVEPDEPAEVPEDPVEAAKSMAMYSVTVENELAATGDTSINTMTVPEAAEAPTESGFYQIVDDGGEVIESGYQELQIKNEDAYYVFALPKSIDFYSMIEYQSYDAEEGKWLPGELTGVISDPETVAELCAEADIDISHVDTNLYTIYLQEEACTGKQIRFVIKEAN